MMEAGLDYDDFDKFAKSRGECKSSFVPLNVQNFQSTVSSPMKFSSSTSTFVSNQQDPSFGRKVSTLRSVQQFSRKVKDSVKASTTAQIAAKEEKIVIPPPQCLESILSKIKAGNKETEYSKLNKRNLNAKLTSSLFLSNIDTEEIASAVHNVEYDSRSATIVNGRQIDKSVDVYETTSKSHFDYRIGALVLNTSLVITHNNNGDPEAKVHEPVTFSGSLGSGTTFIPMQHYDSKVVYGAKLKSDALSVSSVSSSSKSKQSSHHNYKNPLLPPTQALDPVKVEREKKALNLYRKEYPVVTSLDGKLMPLSKVDAGKYFGDEARVDFFDQYRRMNAAKLIIATHSSVATFVSRPATSQTADYSTYSAMSEDNPFMYGSSSVNDMSQMTSSVSHDNPFEVNSMKNLGQDFYAELGSVVSKGAINRSIDRDILSHNSFVSQQAKKQSGKKHRSDSHQSVHSSSSSKRSGKHRDSKPHVLPPLEHHHHTFHGTQHHQEHHIFGSGLEDSDLHNSTAGSVSAYSLETLPSSPRTKYLAGCLREGVHPLPNLILRKQFCTVMNLAHYCMGDKMGRVFAECIQDLPLIESLNLADNNLTDDSLAPLIEAIIHIKGLQELNLSRNKIDGQSSDSLAEYVSRPDCPIKRLTLQSADVDDGECDRFVQMLKSNKQLLELDLSSNLLGTAETLSPGTKTGGESIAEFICSKVCRLEVLKLAWNSIRMTSAVKLAQAIAVNNTLTYLDINNNGLGWAAGEQLGDAIMENRTLKTLLVAGNNFTSSACISICIGIVENLAMKHINLSENPIGEAGAKMIMQISMAVGSRVVVTAANCNTISLDERCWYDPSKPCREYSLNLTQPFDRAVAFHLLQIIASHSTYIFSKVAYEETAGRAAKTLKLKQSMAKDRERFFDAEQTAVLAGLRLLQEAASNTKLGTQLFYEADADNSGRLDKGELQEVLDKIGFKMDDDQLQDILALFDVDGAGTIDLPEFLSLLKSQHRESIHRIKDMIEYPIMALASSPKIKYVPPRKGILHLKVIDGFVRKSNFYTMSSLDQKYAYQMAKDIGDVSMMSHAIKNTKIRYNEALQVFRTMFKETGDKIGVLVKVVPLMMFPFEARQLVSKVTNDERIELARVKLAFGVAVRPMFGSYNGYYSLDLTKELHRICFSKLLEQSQTTNSKRASTSIIAPGRVGDVSQHGNWSSFRNEYMNGSPIIITPAMFTPMPQTGIVEFDFSGGSRPTGGELRLTDKRLCKVLLNLCLLRTESNSDALATLNKWKRKAREMNNAKNLYMPIYQCDVEAALATGRAGEEFYDHLGERLQLTKLGLRSEEIKVNFMGKAGAAEFAASVQAEEDMSVASQITEEPSVDPRPPFSRDDSLAASLSGSESDGESDSESSTSSSSSSEEDSSRPMSVGKVVGVAADEELNLRQKRIRELKHRLHTLLGAKRGVSMNAKAARFVEVIDETFSHLWILSRHLALIVQLFSGIFGDIARTSYFGSYCSDIVVSLFARVIDIHNFETVVEVLSPKDYGCVLCRLGFLNLFNPLKPEVTLELNLARREERVVAKMIVYLSVEEPGINLTYKQFQWKREIDPIPGWDVTEPWMTEEGLSKNGMFTFTYYSGEGRNKFGCIPDVRLRKALTQLVLLDENEVIDEDAFLPDDMLTTAADHFLDNREVWANYLVPGCETYSTFRR